MKRILIQVTLVLCLALSSSFFVSISSHATPSRTDIKRLVVEEAEATTIPPSLALALAKVESNFQVEALSHKGARGVMQIMPQTAQNEFGVHPDELWDAHLNVQLGLSFLEQLINRYGGRWDLALSHYNGGTLKGLGIKARPHTYTRRYVNSVLRWQRRYADQARVWRLSQKETIQEDWFPARTTISNTQTEISKVKDPARRRPVWYPTEKQGGIGLDDFASGRVARILNTRSLLDDFTPIIRWWSS